VWYDAAARMDRWAAADLLREVTTERFGGVEAAVAAGLALRYDGGSCFRSEHYQTEIDHLRISRSRRPHYEPETNGCAEKAIQTLKEQVLWIERFDALDELRAPVRAFARRYNEHWLIRAASLPHAGRTARAPDPSGRRDMIASFTKVRPVNLGRRRPRLLPHAFAIPQAT
jgi:putative transposase